MLVKGRSVIDQGAEMQWSLPIIPPAKAFQNLLGSFRDLPHQKEGKGTERCQAHTPLNY